MYQLQNKTNPYLLVVAVTYCTLGLKILDACCTFYGSQYYLHTYK